MLAYGLVLMDSHSSFWKYDFWRGLLLEDLVRLPLSCQSYLTGYLHQNKACV